MAVYVPSLGTAFCPYCSEPARVFVRVGDDLVCIPCSLAEAEKARRGEVDPIGEAVADVLGRLR